MSAWTCRQTDGKVVRKIVPPRPRIPWWKGPGADSEEKQEPASDIDTGVVDGLKVLDPERPIREAAVSNRSNAGLFNHLVGERKQRRRYSQTEHSRGLSVDNQLDLGPLHCRQAER